MDENSKLFLGDSPKNLSPYFIDSPFDKSPLQQQQITSHNPSPQQHSFDILASGFSPKFIPSSEERDTNSIRFRRSPLQDSNCSTILIRTMAVQTDIPLAPLPAKQTHKITTPPPTKHDVGIQVDPSRTDSDEHTVTLPIMMPSIHLSHGEQHNGMHHNHAHEKERENSDYAEVQQEIDRGKINNQKQQRQKQKAVRLLTTSKHTTPTAAIRGREFDDFESYLEVLCCQVCGKDYPENTMLLCDSCNQGYHMECLVPALHALPSNDWFCSTCLPLLHTKKQKLSRFSSHTNYTGTGSSNHKNLSSSTTKKKAKVSFKLHSTTHGAGSHAESTTTRKLISTPGDANTPTSEHLFRSPPFVKKRKSIALSSPTPGVDASKSPLSSHVRAPVVSSNKKARTKSFIAAVASPSTGVLSGENINDSGNETQAVSYSSDIKEYKGLFNRRYQPARSKKQGDDINRGQQEGWENKKQHGQQMQKHRRQAAQSNETGSSCRKMTKSEAAKLRHLPRPSGTITRRRRSELQVVLFMHQTGSKLYYPESTLRSALGNTADVSTAIRNLRKGAYLSRRGLGGKNTPFEYSITEKGRGVVDEWKEELERDAALRVGQAKRDVLFKRDDLYSSSEENEEEEEEESDA